MKKLFKLLLMIPNDKLLHFIAGENIALIVMIILNLCTSTYLTWLISFVVVFLIAVSKEFYDKLSGNKTDILDVIATLLGGTIGIILSII